MWKKNLRTEQTRLSFKSIGSKKKKEKKVHRFRDKSHKNQHRPILLQNIINSKLYNQHASNLPPTLNKMYLCT